MGEKSMEKLSAPGTETSSHSESLYDLSHLFECDFFFSASTRFMSQNRKLISLQTTRLLCLLEVGTWKWTRFAELLFIDETKNMKNNVNKCLRIGLWRDRADEVWVFGVCTCDVACAENLSSRSQCNTQSTSKWRLCENARLHVYLQCTSTECTWYQPPSKFCRITIIIYYSFSSSLRGMRTRNCRAIGLQKRNGNFIFRQFF